jgi:predicted branched-subunit amino acid permease
MSTIFDFVTVACFLVLAIVFFQWTSREPRTLIHFLLCGVVFAVANQLGNAGYALLAAVLLIAGAAYAALIVRGEMA